MMAQENIYANMMIKVPLLYIISKLAGNKEITCADIGSGYLPTPLVLSEVCKTIYAYDIDYDSLKIYRRLQLHNNNTKVIVINKNIEELEIFGDGKLGLVLASSILEHLKNPAKTLIRIRKNMTNPGYLFVIVPWNTTPCRRAIYEDSTHYFITEIDNWIKLIERTGFNFLPRTSRIAEKIILKYDLKTLYSKPRLYLDAGSLYSFGARVSGLLGIIMSVIHSKYISNPCSRLLIFKVKQ